MVVLTEAPRATRRTATGTPSATRGPAPPVLTSWLQAQSINVNRHAAALRPFRREEFGTGAAAPTEGHIQAVNSLIGSLRTELLRMTNQVTHSVETAVGTPGGRQLRQVVTSKERAHNWVTAIERIWDFYFELFGQRQGRYADWLLSCDRIALDCYQDAYTGIGIARSIPAPPPWAYMRTGISPATFRRGIPLRRLGQQLNPFPLIQLPYHRLVNPWTLGAILHEVSHNLQNDLGLARAVPRTIGREILRGGHPRAVAAIWTRWNRELFADVCGLLLGGPAVVASLMDVIGRSPATVLTFSPGAPHPTPYLRTFISTELLRRMGFPAEAEQYRRSWSKLYPDPRAGTMPRVLLETFPQVNALVVDAVCFRPFPELGNRALAQVFRFAPKEQNLVDEAARRLAAGTDPGVVPERFLIGAARVALDQRLAQPDEIARQFYLELARR
jgi:hypothetical protein